MNLENHPIVSAMQIDAMRIVNVRSTVHDAETFRDLNDYLQGAVSLIEEIRALRLVIDPGWESPELGEAPESYCSEAVFDPNGEDEEDDDEDEEYQEKPWLLKSDECEEGITTVPERESDTARAIAPFLNDPTWDLLVEVILYRLRHSKVGVPQEFEHYSSEVEERVGRAADFFLGADAFDAPLSREEVEILTPDVVIVVFLKVISVIVPDLPERYGELFAELDLMTETMASELSFLLLTLAEPI